jgi:hypothetical protein
VKRIENFWNNVACYRGPNFAVVDEIGIERLNAHKDAYIVVPK